MDSSTSFSHTGNPKLDKLCQRLRGKFSSTPLSTLGDSLVAGVTSCAPGADPDRETLLLQRMQSYLDGFPDHYGTRFFLDAALIRDVAGEISAGGELFPFGPIVPLYGSSWGHATFHLFSESQSAAERIPPPTVELVWFPGADRLGDIELLGYPWLLHELAHPLIEIFGGRYRADVFRSFEVEASTRRVRALNDGPAGKERVRIGLLALQEWWQPPGKRPNWVIEIAADALALWVCGPAYLHAMNTVLCRPDVDFCHLTAQHPPYELRVLALLRSARHLGWEEHVIHLEETLRTRRTTGRPAGQNNRYVALADRSLTQACAAYALDLCEELRLPRCDPLTVSRCAAECLHDAGFVPELGVGLIAVAYDLSRRLPTADFNAWQERTVARLADQYAPERTFKP